MRGFGGSWIYSARCKCATRAYVCNLDPPRWASDAGQDDASKKKYAS